MTHLERHLRRLRRLFPAPLRRILLETVALLALHFVFVQILARVRLLEHLLAPGPGSWFALGVTGMFMALRFFLCLFAPAWFLARLWLLMSRPRPPEHD